MPSHTAAPGEQGKNLLQGLQAEGTGLTDPRSSAEPQLLWEAHRAVGNAGEKKIIQAGTALVETHGGNTTLSERRVGYFITQSLLFYNPEFTVL